MPATNIPREEFIRLCKTIKQADRTAKRGEVGLEDCYHCKRVAYEEYAQKSAAKARYTSNKVGAFTAIIRKDIKRDQSAFEACAPYDEEHKQLDVLLNLAGKRVKVKAVDWDYYATIEGIEIRIFAGYIDGKSIKEV